MSRYKLEFEFGWGHTLWYVLDKETGGVVGNAYMNKYVAQTEVDRLNKEDDDEVSCV